MVVDFHVELCDEAGRTIQRAPGEGAIRFEVPAPDFERIVWQV
jgi:hypothetical protein